MPPVGHTPHVGKHWSNVGGSLANQFNQFYSKPSLLVSAMLISLPQEVSVRLNMVTILSTSPALLHHNTWRSQIPFMTECFSPTSNTLDLLLFHPKRRHATTTINLNKTCCIRPDNQPQIQHLQSHQEHLKPVNPRLKQFSFK